MDDKGVGATDWELWRRWQALGDAPRAGEPDALSLAAYAEGRLSETEAEAVEAWLAAEPEALDDIIVAREINQHPPHLVYQHILGNACNLVAGDDTAAETLTTPMTTNVVPLRRLPQWRAALAWSSIAASLLCASLVGFSMGSDAYAGYSQTQTVDNSTTDSLDTPSTLDSYFNDDSST
jgi:anti-sigma factor RsiW